MRCPRRAAVAAVRSSAVISPKHKRKPKRSLSKSSAKSASASLRNSCLLVSSRRSAWAGSPGPCPPFARFADKLLALADGRRKNAPHEARWLNLTGFCLRPGFGYPGDDFRIEQARRIYAGGLTFGNQVQNEIDWWIFCGRIAGGLNRNQQGDIFQRLSPVLLPKQKRKAPNQSSALSRDVAHGRQPGAAAAQTKTQLGEALLASIKQGEMVEAATWCLSRLGARKLFSGPINLVLPPSGAHPLGGCAPAASAHACAAGSGSANRTASPATPHAIFRRHARCRAPSLRSESASRRALRDLAGEGDQAAAAASSEKICRPALSLLPSSD